MKWSVMRDWSLESAKFLRCSVSNGAHRGSRSMGPPRVSLTWSAPYWPSHWSNFTGIR